MYKLNSIIYDKVIHLLYWKPYLLVRFMINLSQLIEIAAILNANFSNLRYKNIWNNNFLHELIFFIHIFIFDCSINHIIEFTKLMIFFSFFLTSLFVIDRDVCASTTCLLYRECASVSHAESCNRKSRFMSAIWPVVTAAFSYVTWRRCLSPFAKLRFCIHYAPK